VTDAANRLGALKDFPLLYPDAGVVDKRYYAFQVLNNLNPVWWDGTRINLPPAFSWGSRIMGSATTGNLPGPPNLVFPGFLNINRTQDVAFSITKVAGRHTMKAGFYNNHSFKAQNTGAGGVANLGFQGFVDFGDNTNNALDTGFGIRERCDRRLLAVPAAGSPDRGQHDLQQHRVLRAGQLEGGQPPDARLRPPVHPPAAAVRPVPADVELLPGSVVRGGVASAVHLRLQQRRSRLLGQQPECGGSAYG
jgi:hypothetical protein